MTVESKSSSNDNTHINTFKHRLDKYWFDQDVKYNYNPDLSGIENRSIVI